MAPSANATQCLVLVLVLVLPPHMGNTACTRHRARAQSIAQDEESVMFALDELIDESALIRYLSRDMLYILNSFDYPFKIHSLTTPKFKLDAR